MVYDLSNLQTNYMPVLGPNIPFLVLYAKNEVATKIVRVYMPTFVGNPREESHIKVEGLLVGKINNLLFKLLREANMSVAQA